MSTRNTDGTFAKGNPGGGRPKGSGVKTWRGLVADCKRKYGDKLRWQHAQYGEIDDIHELAFLVLAKAVENDEQWAVQEVLNRSLGKPQQSVDVAGDFTLSPETMENLTDEMLAYIIATHAGAGDGAEGGDGTAKTPRRKKKPS